MSKTSKKVGLISYSDSGLVKNKPSVVFNDLKAISEILEFNGNIRAQIIYRDELNQASSCDALFVHCGTIVNFGGKQSQTVIDAINLINTFNGPVVMFSNDVIDGINNKERAGFLRVERPVYYSDPGIRINGQKLVHDIQIIDSLEINQSFAIGKALSQLDFLELEPKYDISYGGRDRPKLIKMLQKVADSSRMLAYWNVSKKLKGCAVLFTSRNFDNDELRVVNSLGKYLIMPFEPNKEYFTSRVFEQLFSNGIVLFDKKYKAYQQFWNDTNTYNSTDELLKLIKMPYSKDRVQRQHEMARNFDFDSYIHAECSEFERMIFKMEE